MSGVIVDFTCGISWVATHAIHGTSAEATFVYLNGTSWLRSARPVDHLLGVTLTATRRSLPSIASRLPGMYQLESRAALAAGKRRSESSLATWRGVVDGGCGLLVEFVRPRFGLVEAASGTLPIFCGGFVVSSRYLIRSQPLRHGLASLLVAAQALSGKLQVVSVSARGGWSGPSDVAVVFLVTQCGKCQ